MTKTLYLPPAYDTYLKTLRPVAWWKLNDPIGSQTVRDFSGNGYTGNVVGGVTFGQTGPIIGTPADTAALFDGSTGYVLTAYSPLVLPLSLNVWYRATTLGSQIAILAFTGVSTRMYMYLSTAGVLVGDLSTATEIDDSIATNDGDWHMATITSDGTTTTLWRDSLLIGTEASSGNLGSGQPVVIGAYPASPYADFFPGDIAQVAIFDYALTPTATANLWTLSKKPLKYNKSLYVPSTYQPSV